MSKNITIKEGGVAKNLTADKLKTNLVGGGTCLWVPEDETQLETKSITENGTYKAEDDGYYGMSQVSVNVPGGAGGPPGGKGSSVIGKNAAGNDTYVAVDENGNISETVIPSYIQITTQPSDLVYEEGETIDFTGLVVTAYNANDESMGAVTFSQLMFPVTVAEGEAVTEYQDATGTIIAQVFQEVTVKGYDGYGNLIDVYIIPAILGIRPDNQKTLTIGCREKTQSTPIQTCGNATFLATRYNGDGLVYFARIDPAAGNAYLEYFYYDGYNLGGRVSSTRNVMDYMAFRVLQDSDRWLDYNFPVSLAKPTDASVMNPVGGLLDVPVQWNRPGDGKLLETHFTVRVMLATAQSEMEAEGGGGQTSGGGAGRD